MFKTGFKCIFILFLTVGVLGSSSEYSQKLLESMLPTRNDGSGYSNYHYRSAESTTVCITPPTSSTGSTFVTPTTPNGLITSAGGNVGRDEMSHGKIFQNNTQNISASKLHELVQHIYAAQARVQLEVNEIKNAQAVATSAQKSLEEAANNVRVITAALQTAQQEVAVAAVRAQTAQLQLAAHDQLLFAARQKVDALSSQMVGLQAEDGIIAPKTSVNIQALLSQLKEPLSASQTPTPIPAVDIPFNDASSNNIFGNATKSDGIQNGGDTKGFIDYDEGEIFN